MSVWIHPVTGKIMVREVWDIGENWIGTPEEYEERNRDKQAFATLGDHAWSYGCT